jgi:hypothetical protein
VGIFHSTAKEDCEEASEMLAGLGEIKLDYMEEREPIGDSDKRAVKMLEELKHRDFGTVRVDPPLWWIQCKALLLLTGIIYVLYKLIF